MPRTNSQIVAAVIVSLWQLIDGTCAALPSTILYSLETGSDEISMSLQEATSARKLSLITTMIVR